MNCKDYTKRLKDLHEVVSALIDDMSDDIKAQKFDEIVEPLLNIESVQFMQMLTAVSTIAMITDHLHEFED